MVVTGGAGFIGSHLVENLAKVGHDVIIVDNLDPYYSVELKKHNLDRVLAQGNVSFVKGDICNLDFLKTVIDKETDFVFHKAARAGVRVSVADPYLSNDVNVFGTLNVLKASLDADVERVVNASSSSVYGNKGDMPFDEKHRTCPISPYGVSKLAAEQYCRVFYEIYNIPTVSLRYFSVYGPRMRPDLAIRIFTEKILKNETINIFGSGNQTRDFTHIDDVVKANMKILETNKADGEILNIGGERRTSINDIVDKLEEIIGIAPRVIYDEEQKGDAKHTLADTSLAKKLIGYSPTVHIEEGLNRYVEWYTKFMGLMWEPSIS